MLIVSSLRFLYLQEQMLLAGPPTTYGELQLT